MSEEVLNTIGIEYTGIDFGVNHNYAFNQFRYRYLHFGFMESGVLVCEEIYQAGISESRFETLHHLTKFVSSVYTEFQINLPDLEKALGMKVKNEIERNYQFGFKSKEK